MKQTATVKDALIQKMVTFTRLSLAWLALMLLVSVIEFVYGSVAHGLPEQPVLVIIWAWLGDLQSWLNWQLILVLVYMLVAILSEQAAKVVLLITMMVWLLAELLLILYFKTALVPLGADILGYSAADINQTLGSSGALSLGNILLLLFVLAGGILFIKAISRVIKAPIIITGIILMLAFVNFFATPLRPNLSSDYANNLALNKVNYFTNAVYQYYNPVSTETDIYADSYIGDTGDGATRGFAEFSYTDPEHFPFLHADSSADVLTPFFNIRKDSRPNIVIILVEGLGRAFTNEGAYLGNFTPFIDSLSKHSLYWKNFLSSGGRTFAVLPSLLGSLPFEKNGFLETGDRMQPHLSLLNLAKANGYRTTFYYGGDAKFDNMSLYLRKNKIDELNDISTFPAGYTKLPAVNGFTWGYSDQELFRHYLATRTDIKTPRLSVLLTVATHDPFVLNDQQRYSKAFEQQMTTLGFDDERKEQYRRYRLQYSSILYADDCLKNFFIKYRERADFNNTIFFITGDHRMPELPMSDKIDRYHVPLIIYSPLLKRTAQIASVSSHFDIAPSLLTFLKNNYNFAAPGLNSFVGSGLDTNRQFRNVHHYPLMQTKTDIVDFVSGNYHLNGQQLFKLNDNMSEGAVDDINKRDDLMRSFEQFKRRNQKIINGTGTLLPDSILNRYGLR